MAREVLLKKGSSLRMEKNITSPGQAKRLSTAMKSLQSIPMEKLVRTGAVKKLNVSDRDDVYVYRVSPKERIVFSPVGEDCVVHDIVVFDRKMSGRSLLTGSIKVK